MDASNRAVESKRIRGGSQRRRDRLTAKRAGHSTNALRFRRAIRGRQIQGYLKREGGTADGALDVCKRDDRRNGDRRSRRTARGLRSEGRLRNLSARDDLIAPAVPLMELIVGLIPVAPVQVMVAVPRPSGMRVSRATSAAAETENATATVVATTTAVTIRRQRRVPLMVAGTGISVSSYIQCPVVDSKRVNVRHSCWARPPRGSEVHLEKARRTLRSP